MSINFVSRHAKRAVKFIFCKIDVLYFKFSYGLTTLNKPKSREVSTNDGIITQNIFNAAVPTSIETK